MFKLFFYISLIVFLNSEIKANESESFSLNKTPSSIDFASQAAPSPKKNTSSCGVNFIFGNSYYLFHNQDLFKKFSGLATDIDPTLFGFQIFCGKYLSEKDCDLSSTFSWLQGNDSIITHTPLSSDDLSIVEMKKKDDMNTRMFLGDVELSKLTYSSAHLSVRSYVGMRSLFYQQKTHMTRFIEKNVEIEDENTDITVEGNFKNHNDVFAVGPRFGAKIEWFFSKKWSFFGDVSYNCLLSSIDTKNNSELLTLVNGYTTRRNKSFEVYEDIQWKKSMDLSFGVVKSFPSKDGRKSSSFAFKVLSRPGLYEGCSLEYLFNF
ncbi:MAG: Lpg1974 family pore-forming outer membrane protein [Rhabdochlamydiaceae bacterium]